MDEFPEIASRNSLVAKHVTRERWEQLRHVTTDGCGFTLARAIAPAVELDNQSCGIYAGDWDSYRRFARVFDPIIREYHGLDEASRDHVSDLDFGKLSGCRLRPDIPVHLVRIRVGRSVAGFGLSPGISREQRLEIERMMREEVFDQLEGNLAGQYHPLLGMDEEVRRKLVADHFLFMSGDPNLRVAGMERDWPEGRGIFHTADKRFLVWVNEEDQLRVIAMETGSDVVGVFERLVTGLGQIEQLIRKRTGREFMLDHKYGFIHSCPTNLGTGMRASVHVDLPGWTQARGVDRLKERARELKLQVRGTNGESGGIAGCRYDISNRHRLGYSEVELVQTLIDGVNALYAEDVELQNQH